MIRKLAFTSMVAVTSFASGFYFGATDKLFYQNLKNLYKIERPSPRETQHILNAYEIMRLYRE